MYEAQTYESILQKMLDRVPDTLDKREGSVIYDALAPAAAELAQCYIELDVVLNEAFADTASREYLIRRAAESGVIVKPASNAILKCTSIPSSLEIAIGSRFSSGELTYIVTEKIITGQYKLKCEIAGTMGNSYFGNLIPIDYIDGLESAQITEVLILGEDEEETEYLRERYRAAVTNPPQDGNIAQYEKLAIEYPGIGRAKVFPLWNGGNTVKIAITNAEYMPAENYLVAEFQDFIDPDMSGKGNGAAPLGCKVTVTSGVQKDISVSGVITLAEGYNSNDGVYDAVKDYLASIAFNKNSVSYMRIGSTILDCPCIAELSNLTINGGITDIPIIGEEIPVLVNLNLNLDG